MFTLPDDLSSLPPVVLVADPDGERERAVSALCRSDIVAAARLALTIQNRYRRAAWLRGFSRATMNAAYRPKPKPSEYSELVPDTTEN